MKTNKDISKLTVKELLKCISTVKVLKTISLSKWLNTPKLNENK